MSTIIVGINENAILSKVEVVTNSNGKLSVDFHFGETVAATPAEEYNPFAEELDENGYAKTSSGGFAPVIKHWAPSVAQDAKKDGTQRTMAEKSKETHDATTELQNLINQFALCFVTSDKFKLDRWKDLGVDGTNWSTRVLDQNVLDGATRNLVNQFNMAVGEFLGKKEHALRVLCVRKSKTSHYPGFRMNFVKDQPVVEPAAIPSTATKLKYTDWEIKNKMNDGTPVATTADATPLEPLTETDVFKD